jgi:hypothetical protein
LDLQNNKREKMASEEEIRKIEKQVLEEYKEIEFRVRERVPEYDKTYLNCQHLIGNFNTLTILTLINLE